MIGYAAGSLGAGLYATAPGVILLYYMTQVLGLPFGLASLAILLPKLVVVIADPAIGIASDRTRSRWGPRRPYLLAGAVIAAAAFVSLFSQTRGVSVIAVFAGVSLSYLALSIAHSLFAVPYVAMPAEITEDRADRARLIGWRMTFVFGGVLVAVAALPLLVVQFGGGLGGYAKTAWVIAAICLASMLGTVVATAHLDWRPAERSVALRIALPLVGGSSAYLCAMTAYFAAMVGNGIATAAAPYYIVHALGWAESRLVLLLGAQIVTALLAMGVWAKLVVPLGFVRAFCLALALSIVGHALLWPLDARQTTGVVLAGIIAGCGAAGVQVVAFTLLADVVSKRAIDTGARLEGLMTGLWTAAEKVALSVGPALCAGILAAGGFVAGTGQVQSGEGLRATRIAVTVAPASCWLVAAFLIWLRRGLLASSR